METITSPTSYDEQPYVAIPSEVGIGGILRVTGDPGVMEDLYNQARSQQRQAAVEALGRPFKALGGMMVEGARNFAYNVRKEARLALHDAIYGDTTRQEYHEQQEELIRQEFRRKENIGSIAVRKVA